MVLRKLSIQVPSDPAIPYLGIDPEKPKFKETPASQRSWQH